MDITLVSYLSLSAHFYNRVDFNTLNRYASFLRVPPELAQGSIHFNTISQERNPIGMKLVIQKVVLVAIVHNKIQQQLNPFCII